MIHQIDECCWIKDGWPVAAHGVGGRVANSSDCSQNHDSYSIEYTFADGAKALVQGRFWPNCYNEFATFVHGTKCAAQFSGAIHAATVQMYKDQRIANDNITWQPPKEEGSPWDAEWKDFLEAIRKNQPYNELKRAALANLAALMGRAAVHSGKIVTWEEATASTFRFCDVDALKPDSPPPFQADAQGRFPAPIPGKWKEI
jgi:predicted dehydrogenase